MQPWIVCDSGRFLSQKRPNLPTDCTGGQQENASIKNRSPPALLLGGHSVSAPPDPISNSAVKPDRADGTNAQALEE
jgi:hypothetical protein